MRDVSFMDLVPGTAPGRPLTLRGKFGQLPWLPAAMANFPSPCLQDPQRDALEAGAQDGEPVRGTRLVFSTTQPQHQLEVQKNDPRSQVHQHPSEKNPPALSLPACQHQRAAGKSLQESNGICGQWAGFESQLTP